MKQAAASWTFVPKPDDVHWTDEQWRAITLRGGNVLVAAAAGSGKTAVLVERIVRRVTDPEDPAEIDRLLVVTFTKAAASEMRVRIGERIEEELRKQPASLYLKRQRQLLNRANISTLHSFCTEIIRNYYYEADVDPKFRIANETERELLKEEVLDDLLEERYGQEGVGRDLFFEVVDAYSGDRSDTRLRNLLLNLYTRSRAQPNPDRWLDRAANMYEKEYKGIEDTPWGPTLLTYALEQLTIAQDALQNALDLAAQTDGPYMYRERMITELNEVNEAMHSDSSWALLQEATQAISFKRLPPAKKSDDIDKLLLEKVKEKRDAAKKIVEGVAKMFTSSAEVQLKTITQMAPHVRLLVELVQQFAKRYEQMKKEKTIVDYEDLEHLTLRILSTSATSEDLFIPSAIAQSYRKYFNEILTDEYQDTNRVQETILDLLSNGDNRFMVGDVKQSIYRFRLAEPSLFLKKYAAYESDLPSDDPGKIPGIRIDLAENFRSRTQVISAVNYIFNQTMDEHVGDVNYDDAAALRYGNRDYDKEASGYDSELVLLDHAANEEEDPEEQLEVAEREADWTVKQIKAMIAGEYPVYDRTLGDTRPVQYSDITILMRSMPNAAAFLDRFKRAGVPIYSDQSGEYFRRIEVQVMMALLRIIDNPYQDVPLAAVLRSPIVGLSNDELAKIRLSASGEPFYHAMKQVVREQPVLSKDAKLSFLEERNDEHGDWRIRLAAFDKHLQQWRTRARNQPLSRLIWELFQETGYDAFVGGLPGGKQRQANLHALYDRARAYEETSFRGLFRFLRFIDRMEERGDDLETARTTGEQENVVKLMSIHKSKGLEFPIVFIVGMNRSFNFMDARKSIQIHQTLGFGSKFIDSVRRTSSETLPELAIKRTSMNEQLSEELRILYVALTRAREKLFLVGTTKNRIKTLEKWTSEAEDPSLLLPLSVRRNATNFFDWIGPAVVRHANTLALEDTGVSLPSTRFFEDESKWRLHLPNAPVAIDDMNEKKGRDTETYQNLRGLNRVAITHPHEDSASAIERLEWSYAYPSAANHFAKQSVSEVKQRLDSDETYAARQITDRPFRSAQANRPRFMQEDSISGVEIGTGMHTVMQHLELKAHDVRSIKDSLQEMLAREQLTSAQAEAIDVDQVLNFFSSPLGERLLTSAKVYREIPFTFGQSAEKIYNDWTDGQDQIILMQGVIDCIFKDSSGNFVLIDYKTDQITKKFKGGFTEAKPVLRRHYAQQLLLYRQALERIWDTHISESYLYFFDGGHALEITEEGSR